MRSAPRGDCRERDACGRATFRGSERNGARPGIPVKQRQTMDCARATQTTVAALSDSPCATCQGHSETIPWLRDMRFRPVRVHG